MLFLDLFLNGLVQESLLALVCIGYTIAYGVAKVLNFAHADILICGGGYLVLLWLHGSSISPLIALEMSLLFGISTIIVFWPWYKKYNCFQLKKKILALIIGTTVSFLTYLFSGNLKFYYAVLLAIPLTAIFATAVFRIGYYPLIKKKASRMSILLSALGFSIAIESLLLIFWGSTRKTFSTELLPTILRVKNLPENYTFFQSIIHHGIIPINSNLVIPFYDFLIVIIFLLVSISLILFFKYSRIAKAIIASADSNIAARSCGIPVKKILGLAFFIGGAIASVGGTLFVLRAKTLYPTAGFSLGIIAFIACVLGGIGSIKGSILGAFLVSMIVSLSPGIPLEEWVSLYIPQRIIYWLPSLNFSDWSYGVVYFLMIIVVLIKPKGLFAK